MSLAQRLKHRIDSALNYKTYMIRDTLHGYANSWVYPDKSVLTIADVLGVKFFAATNDVPQCICEVVGQQPHKIPNDKKGYITEDLQDDRIVFSYKIDFVDNSWMTVKEWEDPETHRETIHVDCFHVDCFDKHSEKLCEYNL